MCSLHYMPLAALFSSGGARECNDTGAVPVSQGRRTGTHTAGRREKLAIVTLQAKGRG